VVLSIVKGSFVFAVSLFTIRFTIIAPLDVNCHFVIDDNGETRPQRMRRTGINSCVFADIVFM
jgi:hypothetical protein